jgi:hypothetical protein
MSRELPKSSSASVEGIQDQSPVGMPLLKGLFQVPKELLSKARIVAILPHLLDQAFSGDAFPNGRSTACPSSPRSTTLPGQVAGGLLWVEPV